jgi:hypothetical protein
LLALVDLVVVIWETNLTSALQIFSTYHKSNNTSLTKRTKIKDYLSSEFSLPNDNGESLNLDKVVEIETLARIVKPTVLVVTEVHCQNINLPNINGFNKYFMLRPDDIPLGKRGGGIGIFAHEKLATSVINVPYLESNNRII